MITPSGASPVLATEAQYGRNLPGELVRHFKEYIAADHGDAYFGVFTTTGKLHLSYADGHLPGDIPLQIVRTYDSGQPDAVGFSTGWTLNYVRQIAKNLMQGTLTLSNGTGQGIVFTQELGDFREDLRRDSEDSLESLVTYLPPADEATGIGSILENTSTNVLTVNYDDGSRMFFEPKGMVYRPTRLEGADSDRYVTLTYNVSNQLTKIENSSGAYFDLTYANGKVHTIEGSDGLDWTYTYNMAGRLVTVDRPDGSDLEYGYDFSGRLDSVKDPLNNEWEYTHSNLTGKVTGIEDPTGSTISFTYNTVNRYTTVTDRGGNSLRYDYAQAGYTTKVTDGEGNYTELSRDSAGDIEWFDDKEDNRWGFDYDSYHQCVEILDPTSSTMSFEYACPSAAVLPTEFTDQNSHTTHYAYDALCNLTIATDATGNCVQYDYNSLSRLTKITDRRNYEWDFEYATYGQVNKITFPDDNYVQFAFDNSGNQTSSTDARGNTTSYVYDELGRLTESTDALDCKTYRYYDDAGNLTSTKDAFDNQTYYYYTVLNQVWKVTNDLGYSSRKWFDANGSLTKSRDFEGNDTQYFYDDANRLTQEENAAENSTYREYDKNGQVTKMTDARGNDTTLQYDVLGRLFRRTDALGASERYWFDGVGNRTKVRDKRGSETTFSYDELNRMKRTTDTFGKHSHYEFDANGNTTKVTDKLGNETAYTFNSRNMQTKVTDALEQETEFTYDANGNLTKKTLPDETEYNSVFDKLNRQTEATDPLGHTSYTYFSSVGTITKRKDAEGHETLYSYDDLYRKTKVTDAEANASEYQYDKDGSLTQITDANGHTFVTYDYNCLNQVVKETDAMGRYSQFAYDANGNLSSKTDPLDNTTTFVYDKLNRLTKKEYEGDGWVGYAHDPNGNVTEASDGTISFLFTYDAENKVTKVRDDTEALEIEYGYDDNGNLLWIEDTAEEHINYYYDKLNRVTDVSNSGTYATIEYATCCSIRTKMTLGNGCYTEYTCDDAKRLTRLANKKSDGTIISAWDYTYDDVGNVTSQTDKDSLVTSYTYDDIYQLTHVNYPSGSDFGYEYDGVGNRTKMFEYTASTITTTYTYDDADELTQYTTSTLTVSFTYASDGCLTSKSDGSDAWTYVWDQERRLAAFKKNGSTLVEYGYNPTGTRRWASDSTLGVENYFYNGGQALSEHNGQWGITRLYIPGARFDEIAGMLDYATDPATTYYVTTDRQKSIRDLVDSQQSVRTVYRYDAWGSRCEEKRIGNTSVRLGLNGWDLTADLGYWLFSRNYDPNLGRLLQKVAPGCHFINENPYSLALNQPTLGHSVYKFACGSDRSQVKGIQGGLSWEYIDGGCTSSKSCQQQYDECVAKCVDCFPVVVGLNALCGECCSCHKTYCNNFSSTFRAGSPIFANDCRELCCPVGADKRRYADWTSCFCECWFHWSDYRCLPRNYHDCWCARTDAWGMGFYEQTGGTVLYMWSQLICQYSNCVHFITGQDATGGLVVLRKYNDRVMGGGPTLKGLAVICPCWVACSHGGSPSIN